MNRGIEPGDAEWRMPGAPQTQTTPIRQLGGEFVANNNNENKNAKCGRDP
jgi:hypothetical protein